MNQLNREVCGVVNKEGMVQLHLFSSPGERDIRYILDASRPYLEQASQPVVAYFPAASWRWRESSKLHPPSSIEKPTIKQQPASIDFQV